MADVGTVEVAAPPATGAPGGAGIEVASGVPAMDTAKLTATPDLATLAPANQTLGTENGNGTSGVSGTSEAIQTVEPPVSAASPLSESGMPAQSGSLDSTNGAGPMITTSVGGGMEQPGQEAPKPDGQQSPATGSIDAIGVQPAMDLNADTNKAADVPSAVPGGLNGSSPITAEQSPSAPAPAITTSEATPAAPTGMGMVIGNETAANGAASNVETEGKLNSALMWDLAQSASENMASQQNPFGGKFQDKLSQAGLSRDEQFTAYQFAFRAASELYELTQKAK